VFLRVRRGGSVPPWFSFPVTIHKKEFHIPKFCNFVRNPGKMIPFEIALETVLSCKYATGTEKVPLTSALGRVLAEDIRSDIDMPPFNKSAVDGYACCRRDIFNELEIIEVIAAGKAPEKIISDNQCAKIMTGAMIPQGADCVLMVEHTEKSGENSIKFIKADTAANIAYAAEDVKKGSLVLEKGILIKPEHIAILAAVGCYETEVSLQPKVSIISTGDELVEPYQIPGASQIRNSNSWQLLAQAQQMHVKVKYEGIARDDEEITRHMLEDASETSDVVLLTGGVSMGDFDFVPEMMMKTGFEILFRTIAIQPGKPTVCGRKDNKICFGLPGNPVASFVIFELLVKPLLYKMMGCEFSPRLLRMPFAHEYKRRISERLSVIPVVINSDGTVESVSYHGSAHIHALAYANGMAFIPIGKAVVEKGEFIDVRFI